MDEKKCSDLELVSSTCSLEALEKKQIFQKAFLMAAGINKLRAMLGPKEMAEIMPLMNSPLGFLTDHDPAKDPSKKPYEEDVAKECFIEATLRGFYPIGNEFNIIAGRFYAAKAGVMRKVKEFSGLTNLVPVIGIPLANGEKAAKVRCSASWVLNGVAGKMAEREFSIKVNNFMGADAITGKAEKKLYSAILNQISGAITPEGDIDETGVIDSTATKPQETIQEKLEKAKTVIDKIPVKPKQEYKASELTPAQKMVQAFDPIVVDTIRGKHDFPDMIGNWTDAQCSTAIDEAEAMEATEKGRGF